MAPTPRRRRAHRRAAAAWPARAGAALLVLAGLLSGCGFTPLYGEREDGEGVTDQMAQVYVMNIPNRLGQVVYNNLRDRIVPYGQPSEPLYVLRVAIRESYASTVRRPDATAARINLTMLATYVLQDARTRTTLTRGVAQSTGAYSVRAEPYPTVVGRQDVQTRVAKDLSDEIRNRLAIYFAAPGAPLPPAAPPTGPAGPALPNPELGTGTLGTGSVETGVFGNTLPGQQAPGGFTPPGEAVEPGITGAPQ